MVGGSVHGDMLPEDLVFRILLSLPVISLLRFKSVSKSWYVQIESSSFINRHVTMKQNNCGNHYVYKYSHGGLFGSSPKPPGILFLSASDEKFDQVCVKKIDLPWTTKRYERKVSLVGSCNGIICVRERVSQTVALWNPATKQLTSFSKFPPIFDYAKNPDFAVARSHFGFGFNGYDYKVVQMTFFCSDPYNKRTCLHVYSFSSDTWKSLDTTNLPFRALALGVTGEHAIYLNGSLYWLGIYYSDKEDYLPDAIVSFDLSNELIKTTSMPDCFYTQNFWPYLFLLGENIACNVRGRSDDSPFEIWVLYEFGVKESWTKLYTIQPVGGPNGFSSNGKFVFLTVDGVDNDMVLDLVLYDPVTQQIIKVLQTKGVVSDVFVYKESLVSVKVGSDAANKEIPANDALVRNKAGCCGKKQVQKQLVCSVRISGNTTEECAK